MLCHGLTKEQVQSSWQSFDDWVKQLPQAYKIEMPLTIMIIPARRLWDIAFLKQNASGLIATDDRPNAPEGNIYWMSNKSEAGQFLHGYRSAWLPDSLLKKNNQRNWQMHYFLQAVTGAPHFISIKDWQELRLKNWPRQKIQP